MSQTSIAQIPLEKRENMIAAAITDILLNASDENKNKIKLIIPNANTKHPIPATQCTKIVISSFDPKVVFSAVKNNIGYYT